MVGMVVFKLFSKYRPIKPTSQEPLWKTGQSRIRAKITHMNLSSASEVQNLLKNHGISPSKGLGQNFLIDKNALEKIVLAANLDKADTVLEIGPGPGVLTRKLAERAGRVIAIEKDKKMIVMLLENLKGLDNVEIVQGDIRYPKSLNLNLKSDYKLVANLPYYISSPVIRQFLETETRPKLMVLLVQKEVAQRICAKPPDMSLLAVSVQFYAIPEIVAQVSKESFWPQPKVDGAIIKIIPRKSIFEIGGDTLLFFKIVKAGFSQPRKQLLNNLSKGLQLNKEKVSSWLVKSGIDSKRRAETLSLGDWTNLTKSDII